jgi:hypothetical protein
MDFNPLKRRFLSMFTTPIDNNEEYDVSNATEAKIPKKKPSDLLMDIYNEDSPAESRYEKFLASQPKESDYSPSKKRRFGAALAGGLAGLSGDARTAMKVSSDIVDRPYRDALNDWTRQEVPLKAAAETESRTRNSKINALKDYITSEHQNTIDESLISSRNSETEHRRNLEDQARKNAEALEKDREARERDRKEDNTRQDLRDKETKRHNTTVESIGRTNASSSATRASAYSRNVDNLSAYRDHLKNKLANQKGDSPSAQKTAEELATHNVILKPGNSQKYSNFYQMDEKGRIAIVPPDRGYFDSDDSFNSEMADYALLQKELKDEKNNILKANHPTGTTSTTVAPPTKKKTQIVSRVRVQ